MKKNLTNLRVWKDSIELAVRVYEAVADFPRRGSGLADQMTRAAVSVPSNIAEGKGRLSDRERRRFAGVARGSLLELQTQLMIAERVGLLPEQTARNLIDLSGDVGRQLNGLIRYFSKSETGER